MKNLIEIVKNKILDNDCVPIVLCVMGSHLYGTHTDNSDIDISGVFVPSKKRLLLNKVTNTFVYKSENADIHLHSIYHFMNMLRVSDPKAVEMLNIDKPEHLLYKEDAWDILTENRRSLICSGVFNFMRFVRSQADKYGVKGERYSALKNTISILKNTPKPENTRLESCLEGILNRNKFVYEVEASPNGIRQINTCGKILHATVTVQYAIDVLENAIKNYGDRSIKASDMQGADYKALSHAIRVGYELLDLVPNRTLTFPSPHAKYLRDIKEGKVEYNKILNVLEDLINMVDNLKPTTHLPEQIDENLLNNITIKIVKETLNL